jgi:hypothetical protein
LADFYSSRFGKNVWLTHHARRNMGKRAVSMATLEQLIESGRIKESGNGHMWIFLEVPGRQDNLICAAVVEDAAVVVKTVMTHWAEDTE